MSARELTSMRTTCPSSGLASTSARITDLKDIVVSLGEVTALPHRAVHRALCVRGFGRGVVFGDAHHRRCDDTAGWDLNSSYGNRRGRVDGRNTAIHPGR